MRTYLFRSALVGLVAASIACGVLAQPQRHAATLESLAARVQVLEDREAIRALILAYGTAHDLHK